MSYQAAAHISLKYLAGDFAEVNPKGLNMVVMMACHRYVLEACVDVFSGVFSPLPLIKLPEQNE